MLQQSERRPSWTSELSEHSKVGMSLDNIGYMVRLCCGVFKWTQWRYIKIFLWFSPPILCTRWDRRVDLRGKFVYFYFLVTVSSHCIVLSLFSYKQKSSNEEKDFVSTSNVRLLTSRQSASFYSSKDKGAHARDNYGLELEDNSSLDRVSLSSTATPILPNLSSASSFESLPLDFSSDVSSVVAQDRFKTSSKFSQGFQGKLFN